ncbi:Sodium-dependent anion transporter family [Olavius algarvensis associated proteobacterium Delta 3]|nr:Sodium-dependent anion transporter family [Olavius algarvensis associated proteobacterium Delta 3]
MNDADAYNDRGEDRIKRISFLVLGLLVFSAVYFSPPWPDAVDPSGNRFLLSREAKGALAISLLAAIWWVFEVVPIGVTSLTIGILQVHFLIRPAKKAFTDFMDPSVLFIFASLIIGMVFTKIGITRRMAYKMLTIVGEKTSMIYLGCFVITAILTLFMAHTAVAATVFPLLVSINEFYETEDKPTRFGKGLFMGMAYVAGAGSIVTLLGAARGAVAIGLFRDAVGREVDFFELSYYMFPVGWIMVALLWGFFLLLFKPEKNVIPGLRERAVERYVELGPMTRQEILAAAIVLGSVIALSLRSLVPGLQFLNNTAILLTSTVLFFVTGILDKNDLENMPWNIILLFAGAISIGLCLWETGAAQWLAVKWLVLFSDANWFVFVMGIAFFVMIMTNIIMNVAAIAISLPVALIIAPYLSISPEIILFASLVTAGMPFLLLVGAAPNAIAYESEQFTAGEFFLYGIPASIMLMAVLGFAVFVLWPLMGMPVVVP